MLPLIDRLTLYSASKIVHQFAIRSSTRKGDSDLCYSADIFASTDIRDYSLDWLTWKWKESAVSEVNGMETFVFCSTILASWWGRTVYCGPFTLSSPLLNSEVSLYFIVSKWIASHSVNWIRNSLPLVGAAAFRILWWNLLLAYFDTWYLMNLFSIHWWGDAVYEIFAAH